MMADDDRFNQWWQQVALPGMEANVPHVVLRAWQDKIEQGAKAAWDAALTWRPAETDERN